MGRGCGTGREEALGPLTERRAGEVRLTERLTERQCHRFTGGLRAGNLKPSYPWSLGRLRRRGSRPGPVSTGDFTEPSPLFCCLDDFTGLTYTKGKESSLKYVFLIPQPLTVAIYCSLWALPGGELGRWDPPGFARAVGRVRPLGDTGKVGQGSTFGTTVRGTFVFAMGTAV